MGGFLGKENLFMYKMALTASIFTEGSNYYVELVSTQYKALRKEYQDNSRMELLTSIDEHCQYCGRKND